VMLWPFFPLCIVLPIVRIATRELHIASTPGLSVDSARKKRRLLRMRRLPMA
jgi:hypothetical protein